MFKLVLGGLLAASVLPVATIAASAQPGVAVQRGASPADARRPVPAPVAPLMAPVRPIDPTRAGLPAYWPPVAIDGNIDRFERRYAEPVPPVPPRRIEPNSFVPLDPRAVISETPSGRIFMGAPLGLVPVGLQAYPLPAAAAMPTKPPAQPKFIMIGAASERHMRGPVHVSYGVQPHGNPGPRVVWLKREGQAD